MGDWNDSSHADALDQFLRAAASRTHLHMPALCPLCGQRSVHIYLHRRADSDKASTRVWCCNYVQGIEEAR